MYFHVLAKSRKASDGYVAGGHQDADGVSIHFGSMPGCTQFARGRVTRMQQQFRHWRVTHGYSPGHLAAPLVAPGGRAGATDPHGGRHRARTTVARARCAWSTPFPAS